MSNGADLPGSAREAANWPAGSDEFVEAFAKGLLVISAFADVGAPLSLAELSARTGLPRAGVRRLVLTLEHLGFAAQRDGRFVLMPKTLRLGYAYLSSLSLREVAQPLIDSLARHVDETVGLSVLDGSDITFIARAEVRGLLRRSVTIGSRLPAFATSMGRALLSGLGKRDLRSFLESSPRTGYTKHTLVSVPELEEEVARVRKRGYSVVTEELELGVCGVAVPVLDGNGMTVAAINVSTNLAQHGERDFVRKVKEPLLQTAREVTAQLARV
jgi:IclR family pca regulon transcriptional regulator